MSDSPAGRGLASERLTSHQRQGWGLTSSVCLICECRIRPSNAINAPLPYLCNTGPTGWCMTRDPPAERCLQFMVGLPLHARRWEPLSCILGTAGMVVLKAGNVSTYILEAHLLGGFRTLSIGLPTQFILFGSFVSVSLKSLFINKLFL